jgi:benzoyl-CoA reductase subunit D
MIVAGIDVGGKNIHAVLLQDGDIVAKADGLAGINKAKAVEALYDGLLAQVGLGREQVERVVATGSAGKRVGFAGRVISDATADARGVNRLVPSARTVINVGSEQGLAIKISAEGRVLDFAINDKCAAGTGTFVEAVARALEIPLDEMARISLESTESIPINAQCAVFGESEVVSLIHAKTPKQDIARAVHDAVAGRVGAIARILRLEKDVVVIGGMALNTGFVRSLERVIKMEIIVPDDPGFVGAIGAAIAASAEGGSDG